MVSKELFSTIREPVQLRWELKRLAAKRQQPMYEVFKDLMRQAQEEIRESPGKNIPHVINT